MIHNITSFAQYENITLSPVFIIIFSAPSWCAPCQKLHEFLNSSLILPQYEILIFDVDLFPSLSTQFNVSSIPAIFVCKGSKNEFSIIKSSSGFNPAYFKEYIL